MFSSFRSNRLLIILIGLAWSEFIICSDQITGNHTEGRLIFEDNFDKFNSTIWKRDIRIPLEPDYEFCVYHNHVESAIVTGGILRISPRLFEDAYGAEAIKIGRLQLTECTSSIKNECFRQAISYNILPPVISARLNTKHSFNFRYGTIEIRAKFPQGDWLYPELWLEPRQQFSEAKYKNARINLGMSRGNEKLTRVKDRAKDHGSRLLGFGFGSGKGGKFNEQKVFKRNYTSPWYEDFHVYSTTWSAEGFTFKVDGEVVGSIYPTKTGWAMKYNAEDAGDMTPYDQEYYLSIGLGVGGIGIFPDHTESAGFIKPWRNIDAKAMLHFWQSKDQWLPTWKPNANVLEIDYIRVWVPE